MTLPQTMEAVQLVAHGGPEALIWRNDIPVPRPGAGEVLVRVLAAGVNMTDINTRIGWYGSGTNGGEGRAAGYAGSMAFPRIQGGDLCGRVVALGGGVFHALTGGQHIGALDEGGHVVVAQRQLQVRAPAFGGATRQCFEAHLAVFVFTAVIFLSDDHRARFFVWLLSHTQVAFGASCRWRARKDMALTVQVQVEHLGLAVSGHRQQRTQEERLGLVQNGHVGVNPGAWA